MAALVVFRMICGSRCLRPCSPEGATEIHRPGETAKSADPRNDVALGCGRPGSRGLICPAAALAACRRAPPRAKAAQAMLATRLRATSLHGVGASKIAPECPRLRLLDKRSPSGTGPTKSIPGTFTSSLTGGIAISTSPLATAAKLPPPLILSVTSPAHRASEAGAAPSCVRGKCRGTRPQRDRAADVARLRLRTVDWLCLRCGPSA
jgi:hypothetical protein